MDLPGDIGPDGHPRQDAHAMQDRGVLGPRSQANDGEVQQNRLRNRLRKKLQEIRTGFERAPVPPPDEVFRHLYYHVEPPWIRSLQSRHLQMIAIGGAIGIGLFIGTGTALHQGGPLSLFFGFLYIGVDLIFTVHALGEMAVMFPISGGFVTFSSRFINHAWGFAVGWNYALQWLVVLPTELVASTFTFDYWNEKAMPSAAFVTIFLTLITIINLFGVLGYAEVEYVLGIFKVAAVTGFIILGLIVDFGGSPNHDFIGGRFWHDPGPCNNGLSGFLTVVNIASFAYGGTEMTGLNAAETANPDKDLPKALKRVFWRIAIFYIFSVIVVGLVVSSDEPRLLSNGDFNTRASPFVIAIENAKISVLPGIYNGIILVTVLSVANTSVFASTRTLVSLAEHGKAPAVLAYIDNRGRPLVAFAVALTVGSLAYIVQASNVATIFNWLLAISGLSTIITWGSICLAHILFRKALQVQGHQLENLTWRTPFGVWGSWLALSMTCAVFIAQVVQAFVSISTDLNNLETMFANSNTTTTTTTNSTILNSSSSNTTTDNSIPLFLALLVFILSFVIWRILSSIDRQFYLDMDLDSGRWEGYHSHPPSLAEEADMEVGIQPDINLDGEVRDDRKWWFKAYEFLFH